VSPAADTSFDAGLPPVDAAPDAVVEPDAAVPLQVDASPPPDDAAPPIVPDAKRVFSTSKAFNGDLKTQGWASSGLEGGDALCNAAALVAGLGGTWRAWLSAPGYDARDRIVDVSPWYLVDRRTLVFDKMFGLGLGSVLPSAPGIDTGPFVAIAMDEHGTAKGWDPWTGTTKTGVASPYDCNGWTSSGAGQGLMGIPVDFDTTWWSDGSTASCAGNASLICFEQ